MAVLTLSPRTPFPALTFTTPKRQASLPLLFSAVTVTVTSQLVPRLYTT